MRLYDPQNIGQWVMQYLGKDNILSPFAGGLRSDSSSQEMQAAPSTSPSSTITTKSSGPDLSKLFSSLSSLVSQSGGGSAAPSSGPKIQWYDPQGRPIPPPRGSAWNWWDDHYKR